jgi:predicted nucleotidyltransferase
MPGSHRSHQNPAIDQVAAWAKTQPDIVALALVGSWARGNPNKRSDIDFMLISEAPKQRLAGIRWTKAMCSTHLASPLKSWRNGFYGAVWSRHMLLRGGQRIELSFGAQSWASLSPLDPSTRYVVQDAFDILYDPEGLLGRLRVHAAV